MNNLIMILFVISELSIIIVGAFIVRQIDELRNELNEQLTDLETTLKQRIQGFLEVFRRNKTTEHMINKDKLNNGENR